MDSQGSHPIGETVKVGRSNGLTLLRPKRRSVLVASAATFAAVYAVLGLIPISMLVGISSFITMREAVSPLAGMIFGPLGGGFTMFIGVLIDFSLGRPVVFLGLDFLVDVMAALVAGLSFTGRRYLAVLVPTVLILIFLLSPGAATVISVGGIEVPFVWMHALSVAVLALALALESKGKLQRLSLGFVAATVFASTMAGHITGGILTEYVYLGKGVLFGYGTTAAYWTSVFYLYPVERAFLTIVGTAVSLPVLRALRRRSSPGVTVS
jgi:hypothetical protein